MVCVLIYLERDFFFMMKKCQSLFLVAALVIGTFSCVYACDQSIDQLSRARGLTMSRAELEDYMVQVPAMRALVPPELYDKSLCCHDYDYEKLTIMSVFQDDVIYEAHSGGYPFMDGRMSKDFLQGYISYKERGSSSSTSSLEQELERLRALPASRLNNTKINQIEKQIRSQNSSK